MRDHSDQNEHRNREMQQLILLLFDFLIGLSRRSARDQKRSPRIRRNISSHVLSLASSLLVCTEPTGPISTNAFGTHNCAARIAPTAKTSAVKPLLSELAIRSWLSYEKLVFLMQSLKYLAWSDISVKRCDARQAGGLETHA